MKLKDLPVGARITDRRSGYEFLVAAQNHPGYKGTVLVSDRILRCAAFDAAEPESKKRTTFENAALYGNNNFELSNIRQWLNSAETYWYRPTHELDTPPAGKNLRYNEQPNMEVNGFLRELSPALVEAIYESDVPVLKRTSRGKGQVVTVKSKIFLPSRTELCMGDESGFAEGAPLPLFEGRAHLSAKPTDEQMAIHGRSWNPGWDFGKRARAALDDAQIFDPKYVWWYWTRTPHLTYSYLVRVVSANGAFSYTMAYNDIVGVRPMFAADGEFDAGQ